MVEECRSCLSIHFLFFFPLHSLFPERMSRDGESERRGQECQRTLTLSSLTTSTGGLGLLWAGGGGAFQRADGVEPRPGLRGHVSERWNAPGSQPPLWLVDADQSALCLMRFFDSQVIKSPCRVLVPVPTRQEGAACRPSLTASYSCTARTNCELWSYLTLHILAI